MGLGIHDFDMKNVALLSKYKLLVTTDGVYIPVPCRAKNRAGPASRAHMGMYILILTSLDKAHKLKELKTRAQAFNMAHDSWRGLCPPSPRRKRSLGIV